MTTYPIQRREVIGRPVGPTFLMPDGSIQGMGQGAQPAPERAAIDRLEAQKLGLEDQLSRLTVEVNTYRRDLAKAKLTVEGGVTSADRRKAAADISRLEGLIASANLGLNRTGVAIHGVEVQLAELRSQRAEARDALRARADNLIAEIGRIEIMRQKALDSASSCEELKSKYAEHWESITSAKDDAALSRQGRAARTVATAEAGIREHTQRAEGLERDLVALEAILDGVQAELQTFDAEPIAVEGGVG